MPLADQLTFIKETVLYVQDVQKIHDWYTQTLGLPVVAFQPGELVFFRAGASMLLCFTPEKARTQTAVPPHFGGGNQHFAFEVPQEVYEAVKAELIEKGVALEHEHTWSNGGQSFYFRDPEQNALEVVQPGIWGD